MLLLCLSSAHVLTCASCAHVPIAVAVEVIQSSKSTQHKFVFGHGNTTIKMNLFSDSNPVVIKYFTDLLNIPIFISGCYVWRNERGQVKSLNLGPKSAMLRPVLSATVKVFDCLL
jgi:hypothetical protein